VPQQLARFQLVRLWQQRVLFNLALDKLDLAYSTLCKLLQFVLFVHLFAHLSVYFVSESYTFRVFLLLIRAYLA